MSDERVQAVHIVGGGLAGAEAAWQIAALGVPAILHEMRPLRATAAHKTALLAELVCSNSFRSDDKEHNAVGLLHEEMRRLGSLIMRAADANQVPAGGALGRRPRGICGGGHGRTCRPSVDRYPPRGDRGTAARGLGQRDHRDRAAHLADAGRRDRQTHGTGRARVLRRYRPDRSPRFDRHVGRVAAVALRQGGTGRIGRRLHQLPAHARAVLCVRRCAARRRQGRVPRLGGNALFRRLPADRGDGRARSRDAAPRPDEAVRPHQPARTRQ